MRHMLPAVPVMEIQMVMELRLIMGILPVRTRPVQQLPAVAAATAIYTGRDIWLDSTPITSATSHLLPGPLPRQQGAPPPQRQPVTAGAIPAADAADVTPDADAAGEGLAAAHVI